MTVGSIDPMVPRTPLATTLARQPVVARKGRNMPTVKQMPSVEQLYAALLAAADTGRYRNWEAGARIT